MAEADLSHRDAFTHPGVLAGDDGALECLQALFIALFDLDVHPDGIAWAKGRHIRPLMLLNKLRQHRVGHFDYPSVSLSYCNSHRARFYAGAGPSFRSGR